MVEILLMAIVIGASQHGSLEMAMAIVGGACGLWCGLGLRRYWPDFPTPLLAVIFAVVFYNLAQALIAIAIVLAIAALLALPFLYPKRCERYVAPVLQLLLWPFATVANRWLRQRAHTAISRSVEEAQQLHEHQLETLNKLPEDTKEKLKESLRTRYEQRVRRIVTQDPDRADRSAPPYPPFKSQGPTT